MRQTGLKQGGEDVAVGLDIHVAADDDRDTFFNEEVDVALDQDDGIFAGGSAFVVELGVDVVELLAGSFDAEFSHGENAESFGVPTFGDSLGSVAQPAGSV